MIVVLFGLLCGSARAVTESLFMMCQGETGHYLRSNKGVECSRKDWKVSKGSPSRFVQESRGFCREAKVKMSGSAGW